MRLTTHCFATLVALAMVVPMARAGDAPATLSPADVATFEHFKLTDSFLEKYYAVEDDIAKAPCRLGMLDLIKNGDQAQSLDAAAAHYDAKPGVHAMLASHNITAKQMILGVASLMSTAMQELAKKHPRLVESKGPLVSDANMAFYRAHEAEIMQHQQQLARREMKASGGKLPACFVH